MNNDEMKINEGQQEEATNGYKAQRIEEPVTTDLNANQTTVTNENNSKVEPVNKKEKVATPKKKKKDIRSILLIILFIFLFAFVMGMPYINEWVDSIKKDTGLSEIERKAKEIEREQEKQNNPKSKETDDGKVVKDKLSTLTCTSTTTALENYDITVVEKFGYNSKGLVVESSKATTYRFNSQSDKYNELKNQCNENSLKYVEKKGYEIACSYNDTEVVMEDKFDLATFTTINDGMTKIEANAKYKDKIDTIKKKMASLNYVCE